MEKDELLGSEYDNSPDLMGFASGGEILAYIAKYPKEQQSEVAEKLFNKRRYYHSKGTRADAEAKLGQLPKEIREGLKKKRLQLCDTRLYVVKDIGGKTQIDMLQGTDAKNIGLANLANMKLEKDSWFSLSAMRALYAVASVKEKADFGLLPPEIMNGEFELEAGQKKIIGLMSNEAFDTKNRVDLQIGTYAINSTKIIEPQVEIKNPFKFASVAADGSFMKVVYIGQSVVPY